MSTVRLVTIKPKTRVRRESGELVSDTLAKEPLSPWWLRRRADGDVEIPELDRDEAKAAASEKTA